MKDRVDIKFIENTNEMVISCEKHKMVELPIPDKREKTFLGWSQYAKLDHGYMHMIPHKDEILYAVYADDAAYVIESHYRGDVDDYTGPRCQFRRYVVDIYLEHASAFGGQFKIDNCNQIFYYLGYVPEADIKIDIEANTNTRGHAYRDEAFFTTSDITVKWTSEHEIDASTTRQKIVRIMLAFSKWGIGYSEMARLTSDEILAPDYTYEALAGNQRAAVSANFYKGIVAEDSFEDSKDDKNVLTVTDGSQLNLEDAGEVLSRFAVLADSHIGRRYRWENYDWLYRVYEDINRIHKENPLDFVLQLGDNIDDGYDATYEADYELYLQTVEKLSICDSKNPIENRRQGTIPHYEMQGNHDPSMHTRFFRNKLWYTENANGKKVAYIGFFVDYGGYPAVNYNISGTYESYCSYGIIRDETIAFIEQSILEACQHTKHIVLCSHFGIAQDLSAPILPESGLGKIYHLCEKYHIKLYMNGHEHCAGYKLRKYMGLYDYDVPMTKDNYAIFEMREKCVIVTIYDSKKAEVQRIDRIKL
ncbi:MAG: metallophosphoesterase [Faecalimonas sp.]|nr:metallophosphoesterase [Faecalimonas sp.]